VIDNLPIMLAQDADIVAAAEAIEHVAASSTGGNLGYLIASVLFIFGIIGMTHPRTAVRGNLLGALGMLIAVLVTLAKTDVSPWVWLAGMQSGFYFGHCARCLE